MIDQGLDMARRPARHDVGPASEERDGRDKMRERDLIFAGHVKGVNDLRRSILKRDIAAFKLERIRRGNGPRLRSHHVNSMPMLTGVSRSPCRRCPRRASNVGSAESSLPPAQRDEDATEENSGDDPNHRENGASDLSLNEISPHS